MGQKNLATAECGVGCSEWHWENLHFGNIRKAKHLEGALGVAYNVVIRHQLDSRIVRYMHTNCIYIYIYILLSICLLIRETAESHKGSYF